MNPLLRKELRLIFPSWVAAMVLAVLPVFLLTRPSLLRYDLDELSFFLALPLFGLGIVVLSVASFGLECSSRTLGSLLAQPLSRWQLWSAKVGLLGLAVGSVLLAFCLSSHFFLSPLGIPVGRSAPDEPLSWFFHRLWVLLQSGGMIALVAMAGGLWSTLLTRQLTTAFWLTILTPIAIILLVSSFLHVTGTVLCTELLLYSVAGIGWSYWLTLHLEDRPWRFATVRVESIKASRSSVLPSLFARRRPAWLALLYTEIGLQKTSLIFVACLVLLHLVDLVLRRMSKPGIWVEIEATVWVLWLLMPILIGGVAMAEERSLGLTSSLFCLPFRRSSQFLTKTGVVVTLGVAFGALLPVLLESLGVAFGLPRNSNHLGDWGLTEHWMALCLMMATCSILTLYASMLCDNSLQAFWAGLLMCFVGAVSAGLLRSPIMIYDHLLWDGWLGWYITWPLMSLLVLWLAYQAFCRAETSPKFRLRIMAFVVLGLLLSMGATALTYNRAWEAFIQIPPEPRHGPAVLVGPVTPKLVTLNYGPDLVALLPDGRLWAKRAWYDTPKHPRNPSDEDSGTFLGGTNWVQLSGMLALQSDGSLWEIHQRFLSYKKFSDGDIKDVRSFASRLARKADPVSAFIYDRLDKATIDALAEYQRTSQTSSVLEGLLVTNLNSILDGPSIYDTNLFAPFAKSVQSIPTLTWFLRDKYHLSLILLEDAFPKELKPYVPRAGEIFQDHTNFSLGDITNLSAFATKLATRTDAVSAFLNGKLDRASLEGLAEFQRSGRTPPGLEGILISNLNAIVAGPSIYDSNLFASLTLRPDTSYNLALYDMDKGRFNRDLLEVAFPQELKRTAFSPLDPEARRIGSDADWVRVTAEGAPMALKKDGTMWGLRRDEVYWRGGRLYPVRLGTGSNWVNVISFPLFNQAFGIEKDGSEWSIEPHYGPNGAWSTNSRGVQFTRLQDRVRPVKSTPARLVEMKPAHDRSSIFMGIWLPRQDNVWQLDSDGDLWFGGHRIDSPAQWLRPGAPAPESESLARTKWRQIVDLGGNYDDVALTQDGRMFVEACQDYKPFQVRLIGRHSDWIAIDRHHGNLASLAADGTITLWADSAAWSGSGFANDDHEPLLRPTLQPMVSYHIPLAHP